MSCRLPRRQVSDEPLSKSKRLDIHRAADQPALGLNAKRLIQEVISGAHAQRIHEDFKSGVRAGVNGTPSFFINGQRYDAARALEPLLDAISQPARVT